ncbi:zinc-binding dehydrogenase [Angustibacter sp. Root456]|uniref:zinc-dependent alcohol dehydrogenase n=1 Tax=Angustibacter sp. Root456 TaxID=1736539 RepID=UPI0006F9BD10|nr:zinc-binding dehydrogenase [Angustibacter sp. Root456]KQX62205.1 zinc-binding alcohol dehydrogenase [Angustibacter sp. Root456]
MLALEMFRSIPRYAAAKAVGGRVPGLLVGPMAPVRLVTRDEPVVRRAGWAQVRPLLSGICGSDLGAVTGSTSLYFSALVSMPFVPGHEIVGELVEDCDDLPRGTRVVIDPVLACAARGVEPCEPCRTGRTNLCNHVTVGHVSPGLQTGFCRDTGGGWGERLTVHRSQLHPVPDGLSDERAVLVEPLACAVQLARRAQVPAGGSVLVSGAGAVGLFAVLALRHLTDAGRITVIAKHGRQEQLARAFGASDVAAPNEAMRAVRRTTRALRVAPEGLPGPASRLSGATEMLLGGVDVGIDAVGSTSSLDTVLRSTKAGGRVVLSGMPSAADLSPAWFRELEVAGTYASTGDAFDVAIQLAQEAPLDDVVGGRYPLHRWREALDHAQSAGRLGTVKVCFDVRSRA